MTEITLTHYHPGVSPSETIILSAIACIRYKMITLPIRIALALFHNR